MTDEDLDRKAGLISSEAARNKNNSDIFILPPPLYSSCLPPFAFSLHYNWIISKQEEVKKEKLWINITRILIVKMKSFHRKGATFFVVYFLDLVAISSSRIYGWRKETLKDDWIFVCIRISQFYSILTSSIDVIFKFCDRIPGYNQLIKPDRELLFRSSCLQLFTLRLAHR